MILKKKHETLVLGSFVHQREEVVFLRVIHTDCHLVDDLVQLPNHGLNLFPVDELAQLPNGGLVLLPVNKHVGLMPDSSC